MFDIADIPFSGVSDEEKSSYSGKMKETGSYQGYKPRQYWVRYTYISPFSKISSYPQHIDNGVHDQLEHYNSS
jgi:hypothetical protein